MEKKLILKNNKFIIYLKSAMIGVMVSMVGVLLFALVLKFVMLSDSAVNLVNQGIKAISILLSIFYLAKFDRSRLLVKSLIVGALYSVLSFFIFSLLSGNLSFSVTILNDVLFAAVTAIICSILVNMFKRK